MKNIIYSIFVATLCLSLVACKDPFNNEQLPPATQTGENTFSFKFDGDVWLPYYRGMKFTNYTELTMRYRPSNGGVTLIATRETDDNFSRFYFTTNNMKRVGDDLFDTDVISQGGGDFRIKNILGDTLKGQFTFRDESRSEYGFYLNFSKQGYLILTKIDTINNIVSGEFEFTVKNHEGRELKITEGRFDYTYPYQR